MKTYSDWNCRLLPMMGDLIADPNDSIRAMLFLKDKFGLSRFCMMPEFDCTQESISAFLIRRDKAWDTLRHKLTRDIHVMLGASATVVEGLSQEVGLKKLILPNTNLFPIRLPFFPTNETAKELNRLLYHFPYRILLLSFDTYLNVFPMDEINRWISLPNVAYQWNYKALKNPLARDLIKMQLSQNATVLFGTELYSYGKACFYELDHFLKIASEDFNDYQLDHMFFHKGNMI